MPKQKRRRLVSIVCQSCGEPVICYTRAKGSIEWEACPDCMARVTGEMIHLLSLRTAILASELHTATTQLNRSSLSTTKIRLGEIHSELEVLSRETERLGR